MSNAPAETNKPTESGKDEAEMLVTLMHNKLAAAFDLFDGEKSKTVDVKEIPTIIHSLNLVPTQAEIHDLITEMETDGDDSSDMIRFEKFLTVMTDVIMNRKYRPANENQIYKALQVLDTDKKGYYTKDDLVRVMTSEGEPFNTEEINEMLQTCLAFADPESQSEEPHILYKYYINELVVDDEKN